MLTIFLVGIGTAYGQGCPVNVGFENGSFANWTTKTGTTYTSAGKNVIALTNSAPVNGRHTLNNSKTALDFYGNFPVLAPNGSGYSVKLGNEGTGSQAEGISYLINVPANNPSFVLTYQYAVVFEDPSHPATDQPRFTAKVLDISTNTYITCASFDYVATASLPGFTKSTKNNQVIYKAWTPVTINLSGYQGKQLLLEFNTADCTQGGHFGYAYVDVDENCSNIIQGNNTCSGSPETTLRGPGGYSSYKWYNKDKSVYYGDGESITIKPALKDGDEIVLDLVPFAGFGCPNSVTTKISEFAISIDVVPIVNACKGDVLDLSSSQYILDKNNLVTYTCYSDVDLKVPVDITKISQTGIYYIKATSPLGCTAVKPIDVTIHEIVVDVAPIIKSCADSPVDLTSSLVQKTVPSGLGIKYFSDAALSIPIIDPKNINQSGDYYIEFKSVYCSISRKVNVEIFPLPILKLTSPAPVCAPATVDITASAITIGSDPGLTFTYFTDAAMTQAVSDPTKVSVTGDYYIRALNSNGCTFAAKIFVEIYPLPVLAIVNPAAVCKPESIDLTNPDLFIGTTAGVKYTFADDKGMELKDPKHIDYSGTFVVTIENANGCTLSKVITTTVYDQPKLTINQPKKVYITQFVDVTKSEVISGSTGYEKVAYWNDAQMSSPISNPARITRAGTYYISITNSYGCISVDAVEVITVPWPKIMVPTAFTPSRQTNNKLYPFLEGIEKLNTFKIYNKWGNLVFETNKLDSPGWDGTLRNNLQPFETYSWFAEGVDFLGVIFTAKGKTVLIP
ncbi:MAG: gliding motility-associated C-terminal domain-containing protein [Pedobacter sp.]|nr:gliding motility-associated C-terminal domain-containing protein [Pedobacter sp.]MDQ8052002.1 gliding motility-associated C-terminal domain-containing protein [Pedobacter sp.]